VTDLPRAILLDLDDTILDLSASADRCWQRVCERFAPRIEGLAPARLLAAIAERRLWFWDHPERHRRGRLDLKRARREIVAAALSQLDVDAPALGNEMADTYALERKEAIAPMPGAIDALRALRKQGIRLALVTNGTAQEQRHKIERFDLGGIFDCIVIEGEFGAGKPDERVYLHALEQLGVEPKDVWMVGDNPEWDVRGPQRLGVSGIWLDYAGQGLPEGSPVRPDRIIRSLSELV
jgi:putative hydrolase of the HAD superfamily